MSLPLLRLLGVLLVLVVISPGAQSKERPMLAVLDFASGGAELTQEELSLLSDVSRAEARRVLGGAYTIITQESIEQLLKAHGKTLEQCQGSCETETGKLLGAELVVSGRLVKAFGAYKANLKLHRTEPPELLDARVLTVNTLPALEGAVRQGTAQILASLAPASPKTTSAPSRPTAPNPPTTTRPSTREALERTERDMARSLAQRTSSRTSQKEARRRALDAAAKKAAKKSARKAAKKTARKAARKVAKRTARSRVKKATRARPKRAAKQQGKPARCQGIPWTCIGWIEDGAWLSLGVGPGTVSGGVSEVSDLSMTFEVLKIRYPYDNDSFWFTNLGAFVMPSTSSDDGRETSARWGSLAAGWGFAIDSDMGLEFSAGFANGELTDGGDPQEVIGPVGTLGMIWRLSGVPYRLGLMAASLESGSSESSSAVLVTNWTVGVEF